MEQNSKKKGKSRANIKWQLIKAAEQGDRDFIKNQLDSRFDVNTWIRKDGTTLLMTAAEHGNIDCVKLLIAAGIDVNQVDITGRTAIMFCPKVDCMEALIQTGADVNTANRNGVSVLMESARRGRTKSLKLLITAGADVNKPDKSGRTPFMHACENGHIECVNELVAADCDLNAQWYGSTALTTACHYKMLNVAKQLIDAGCEVDQEFLTAALRYINFARNLLASGADFSGISFLFATVVQYLLYNSPQKLSTLSKDYPSKGKLIAA